MNKIVPLSFLLSSILSAGYVNPLGTTFMSIDHGGTLPSIDAFKDGIGALVIGDSELNTIIYNDLVFKYGDVAKANNVSMVEEVLNGSGTPEDKLLVGTLNITLPSAPCDDGNPGTINDTMIGAVCMGTCGGKLADQWVSIPLSRLQLDSDIITYAGQLNSICTTNITDMSYLFAFNTTFNEDISQWDTSNVTTMSGMFVENSLFNKPIGNWNTSNVTNMSGMFDSAELFNQPLNNWNTLNVIDMSGMFGVALSFNQPLDNWNTSNVTNMSQMFSNARSFNQPIGNWNTNKVVNMSGMFTLTDSFNQPINNWDVSSVTNMSGMFVEAKVFNQPINNWDTRNSLDMTFMFYNAILFNQNISSWTPNIVGKPSNFDNFSGFAGQTALQPQWK